MPRLSKLSRSIAGKTALITGAASGMGRATAHLFADEGARVVVTDLDLEKVTTVVNEIKSAGGEALGLQLDVADATQRNDVVAKIIETWGALDILVNNAGIAPPTPIDAENFDALWDKTLAVLLSAQVQLVRSCLEHLSKSGEGRVVNAELRLRGRDPVRLVLERISARHEIEAQLTLGIGAARHHSKLHLPRPDSHGLN